MKNIVLDDPNCTFKEGQPIEKENLDRLLSRGGCAIPCCEQLSDIGLSGWAKRCYGLGLDGPLEAKVAIHAMPGRYALHWRARIDPTNALGNAIPVGSLQMVARTYMATSRAMYVADSPPSNIGDLVRNPFGHWFLSGQGKIQIEREGIFAFALIGMLSGARVCWSGISLVS